MYYTDKKLQYPVRVEKPNPLYAKMLQQAIGGVEGEIRVCMQYFFQAWGCRGPVKYRDMLLNTATEEISHIEMLATAVALNLQNAPLSLQEEIAGDPIAGSVLRDGPTAYSVERLIGDAGELGWRAVQHVAHLREWQHCGRYVLQRGGRGDWTDAGVPVVPHDG